MKKLEGFIPNITYQIQIVEKITNKIDLAQFDVQETNEV